MIKYASKKFKKKVLDIWYHICYNDCRKQENGGLKELALLQTCAGETAAHTTGLPRTVW